MAEHGKELDNNAVASMPYAEATVKEAMRIEPIVTVLSRVALKTFEVGGYTIPKVRLCSIFGFLRLSSINRGSVAILACCYWTNKLSLLWC